MAASVDCIITNGRHYILTLPFLH